MQVAEAQNKLKKIIRVLQGVDQQLKRVSSQLPRPENQDEMFECLIPCDPASGVSGAIEFIREEPLSQVIEGLQDAATLTAEKLVRRFKRIQAKNGGSSGNSES